ncbi:cytochrome P450 [Saccharothrix isguenensis]
MRPTEVVVVHAGGARSTQVDLVRPPALPTLHLALVPPQSSRSAPSSYSAPPRTVGHRAVGPTPFRSVETRGNPTGRGRYVAVVRTAIPGAAERGGPPALAVRGPVGRAATGSGCCASPPSAVVRRSSTTSCAWVTGSPSAVRAPTPAWSRRRATCSSRAASGSRRCCRWCARPSWSAPTGACSTAAGAGAPWRFLPSWRRTATRSSSSRRTTKGCVGSLLSAGVDTTVHGLAAVLYAFATHPDQWQRLRAEPHLARVASDEAVRWESPVQTFIRTATRDVRIGGSSSTSPAWRPRPC